MFVLVLLSAIKIIQSQLVGYLVYLYRMCLFSKFTVSYSSVKSALYVLQTTKFARNKLLIDNNPDCYTVGAHIQYCEHIDQTSPWVFHVRSMINTVRRHLSVFTKYQFVIFVGTIEQESMLKVIFVDIILVLCESIPSAVVCSIFSLNSVVNWSSLHIYIYFNIYETL